MTSFTQPEPRGSGAREFCLGAKRRNLVATSRPLPGYVLDLNCFKFLARYSRPTMCTDVLKRYTWVSVPRTERQNSAQRQGSSRNREWSSQWLASVLCQSDSSGANYY